ncbi:auxin-responsive protein SAUR72-like [Actinidia eriantha]|uniref:auxin-responsive protein SAUR72-like n=1 Tax=Actinidia eriantha TaxID=165200 RepID=UPI00258DCED1|nr:auxin-responsive protein SAUR72-like [Actinidia eriantha]
MESKKSNKISEIVRLQQILKKWKKLAKANANSNFNSNGGSGSGSKSINKFLKKTISFSDLRDSSAISGADVVPKGYVTVCVGKELKRFVIPTEYLGHQAFGILLGEAEEEFGFQQEGVLKIPCEVPLFERILKPLQDKREVFFFQDSVGFDNNTTINNIDNTNINNTPTNVGCFSPDDCDQLTTPHPQLCR